MTVRELIQELEKYDGDTQVHIDPLGLEEDYYASAVRTNVSLGLHPADKPFEGVVICGLWASRGKGRILLEEPIQEPDGTSA